MELLLLKLAVNVPFVFFVDAKFYSIFLFFHRTGDSACVAYVTFKNPHAVETAVLLSVR